MAAVVDLFPQSPCDAFERLPACLAGLGRVGGIFSESEDSSTDRCVWSFAGSDSTNVTTLGGCSLFTNCSVPRFDPFEELQQLALLPQLNTTSPWLVSMLNPCLALAHVRAGIAITAIVLTLVVFSLVCGMYILVSSGRHPKLYNVCRKSLFGVYGCAVAIPAGFAMYMAWKESVTNLALLPMFALCVLGLEGLHYLPEERPFVEPRVRAAEAAVERAEARCDSCCPLRIGSCIVGVCVSVLFSVTSLLACTVGIIGMVLIVPYETLAVQWIAWLDVIGTLCQGVLMVCGMAGVAHYHAFLHCPHWLAILTFLFALGLGGIALAMTFACAPEKYLLPTSTLDDFEQCSELIAGRAYALAFLSMLRQVVLAVANAVASRIKDIRPTHAEESAGVQVTLETVPTGEAGVAVPERSLNIDARGSSLERFDNLTCASPVNVLTAVEDRNNLRSASVADSEDVEAALRKPLLLKPRIGVDSESVVGVATSSRAKREHTFACATAEPGYVPCTLRPPTPVSPSLAPELRSHLGPSPGLSSLGLEPGLTAPARAAAESAVDSTAPAAASEQPVREHPAMQPPSAESTPQVTQGRLGDELSGEMLPRAANIATHDTTPHASEA